MRNLPIFMIKYKHDSSEHKHWRSWMKTKRFKEQRNLRRMLPPHKSLFPCRHEYTEKRFLTGPIYNVKNHLSLDVAFQQITIAKKILNKFVLTIIYAIS